ncbi:MAG TPA: hypothetical protein EYG73_10695 [Arcobacter sp.]|nr:hypothetical protein [Arcobacter sp.]
MNDELDKTLYEIIPRQKIPFYFYILSKWSLILFIATAAIYEVSYFSIALWVTFVFLVLYQKTILKRKDIYKSPLFLLYKNILNRIR